MTDAGPSEEPIHISDAEDDEIEPDEYIVEAIRAKRKNARTGLVEYLIKWENYPESANTWEPIDNLKCPDLILKFQDQEKSKRKRSSITESQTKRSKLAAPTKIADSSQAGRSSEPSLLVEDEIDDNSSTETLSSLGNVNGIQTKKLVEPMLPKPKGFDRGLPVERVVGSCTDDNDKLWFFVKWKGLSEMEIVDANELEEKAPREMCCWYRERLYYTLNNPTQE